jgi:hypothetical protein
MTRGLPVAACHSTGQGEACFVVRSPRTQGFGGFRPGLSRLAQFRANVRMTKTDGDPEGTPPSARNIFLATHHSPLFPAAAGGIYCDRSRFDRLRLHPNRNF